MRSIAIHGDCMDLMRSTASQHYDLAVCDPPYFSGPERRNYYGGKVSKTGVKRRYYGIENSWIIPGQDYFDEVRRVSKNWIIWGMNYYSFCPIGRFDTPRRDTIDSWIQQNPTGWIVWDKCNGKVSFNDYELAFTSYDRPTIVFRYMWNGMMQGKSIQNGHIMNPIKSKNQKRIHPTEKPINLYKWTFMQYANERSKILDTHLGSGSSRIAAYDAGLDFTGVEINENVYDLQEKRFNAITSQMRLNV